MWRSKVSHGAIVPSVADLEVGERALDAGLRPVGVGRADVALDLRRGGARRAAAGRASPGTPPSWETRRTARASRRRRTRSRARAPAPRSASSRTTLPPHDWPATIGRSSPSSRITRGQVVRDGRHVVRAVGLGGAAVAAEVDGDGEVAAVAELARDAVPHPGVRGEPVDEHERRRVAAGRRWLPRVDGQLDARRDGDTLRVHRVSIAEAVPRAAVGDRVSPRRGRAAGGTGTRRRARRWCRPRSTSPSPRAAGS